MAVIRPGTVKGGFVWTGFKWEKVAERTADRVAQEKRLKAAQNRYYQSSEASRNREQPLASWPGKRPVSSASAGLPKAAPPSGPSAAMRARQEGIVRGAGRGAAKRVDKPGAPGPASSSTNTSGANASIRKKPMSVLQQNTMWVTAAQSKTGKGYLAQKGKPEKRVTANVKIQTATSSGKAAGSTYSYAKGKTVGKVVKKK